MDETTARRIAQNQAFFREVNETIAGVAETLYLKQDPAQYVCECGDVRCSETIPLSLQAYEHVRAQPARFAVLYGHEIADVEVVVESRDGYLIVEKVGAGKDEAARADLRSNEHISRGKGGRAAPCRSRSRRSQSEPRT